VTYDYGKDTKDEWRWHLKAGNNKIIATSGEGYLHEQDCLAGIELVKSSKNAPVKKVGRI
jgi:uncharacterized protein YegP (UPF0339 family)